MGEKKIRVLIGKPGLDGHDQGAKIVVRALMEAGFDVVYSGLRRSVEEIVQAAADEKVDVIGLSIMSGSHLPICEKMKPKIDEAGLGDRLWIVGGVIPEQDRPRLLEIGVDAVFPTATPFEEIVNTIRERVK
jgi:methylmalonyl-CoA mutase, C-terminal domain